MLNELTSFNNELARLKNDLSIYYTSHIVNMPKTEQNNAIANLLSYLLSLEYDFGPDLEKSALLARNSMEILIILEYCTKKKNLDEWIMQKYKDEIELLNCLVRTIKDEEKKMPFEKRKAKLESLLPKNYIKRIPTSTMAECGTYKLEYENFNQQFSKFIHPTSFSINEVFDNDMKIAFCISFKSRVVFYMKEMNSLMANFKFDNEE